LVKNPRSASSRAISPCGGGEKDAISEHEGEVTEVDAWGKKQLAYEIKDYRSGDYTILEFNAQTTVVNELERIFKIMDGVLRYLVVRNDA
jgi:small subunit ribosomal protein S6